MTQISAYLPRTLTEKGFKNYSNLKYTSLLDWHKLCQFETAKERFEYLIFLNKRGKRRAAEKQKEEIRKELAEQRRVKLAEERAEMNEQPQKFLLQTGNAEIGEIFRRLILLVFYC